MFINKIYKNMSHAYCLCCIILLYSVASIQSKLKETCDSNIYCFGEILETVQMSFMFEDSKTFVDMKMKIPKDEVISEFKSMMQNTDNKPDKMSIVSFLEKCFSKPGSEFEPFTPLDWVKRPNILNKIVDVKLREFAINLHELWKHLGRKTTKNVYKNPEMYSIVYVPKAVMVPGGRFREFYYWDSYWVILGLIHSEMLETSKGMLENFMEMIKNYGLIPNGGRVYYLRRSQPPLLTPMVKLYYEATKDKAFLTKHIDVLEKELQFWLENRLVNITISRKTVKLAIYIAETAGPRPESYREDVHAARHFKTEDEKNQFYAEVKSACESGWDFSSRWFMKDRVNNGNLTDTKIRSIVPVDLNAIIYWNAAILEKFFSILKLPNRAKKYKMIAADWLQSVTSVLWNSKDGIWYDYDLEHGQHRKYFFPSNVAPLWAGCYDKSKKDKIGEGVVKYLNETGVINYKGGIPTSLVDSGEQWDFPNAWPPLQHMVISGLYGTQNKRAQQLAYDFANNWIQANYKGYTATKSMFEKYDAVEVGAYGGGGEYAVQTGFGWTNGVCLDLLHKYGSKLTAENMNNYEKNSFLLNLIVFLLLYLIK